MNQPLIVSTRQQGHAFIIDMDGDLTKSAETDLFTLQAWDKGLEQGCSYLIFNFSSVGYINSLGIAVLIRIVRALHHANHAVFAYGISSHYKKLFRMVGLTEYMAIYDDEYSIIQRISAEQ